MKKTPALLVIMDGFGVAPGNPESDHAPDGLSVQPDNLADGENDGDSRFDAIRAAKTPCLDRLGREYALTVLSASGNDVGFPAGQPGRAAAGCMNIGAGRIVYQDLVRISRAVADGSFYQNPVLIQAMSDCFTRSSALHLIGVLSDTGSYSHIGHLFALLKMAVEFNLKHIYLHLILEGREERDLEICRELLRRLTDHIHELNAEEKIKIATLMGLSRVTGNIDALESAYDAMVYGESGESDLNPENILSNLKICEDLDPVICDPDCSVSDHDALIFWSFRPLKNLARAFADPDFELFTRQLFPLTRVSFSDYQVPGVSVAFPNPVIHNTIGEYLSALGLTQLRIAKASRFDEIGYYLNGCAADVFPGEDRISEFSSASEIASACIRHMESGVYDLIILGLPDCEEAILSGSPDIADKAIQAVESIDACIGAVADAALKMGGIVIVTASCGGVEALNLSDSHFSRNYNGTTNPAPFLLCGAGSKLRSGGRLSDIAPTLLDLMGLACPPEMDGKTLIVE